MNLNCDMAIDLVALYKDGLASDASRESVEAHLKECPTCRKYYREYDKLEKIDIPERNPTVSDDIMKHYSEISLKLRRRRNMYTGLIASCACIAVSALLFSLLYKKPFSVRPAR